MKLLDYIKFLANIGRSIPGVGRISRRLASPEFIKATKFLYQNSLKSTDISGGIVVVSIAIFAGTSLILSMFLVTFSAIILSATIAMLSCLIIINSIVSRYNHQLIKIEKVTPYVLEELATIYLTTDSVFEAIQYVSKGEYDIISAAFSKMILPLNLGVSPEQLLLDFAINQPSITLRRGLLSFIQLRESSTTNLEAVITDAHENLQRRYERLTLQWESRMMVYSGMLVFLPIIIILGIAVRGLANNPIILLIPIFQYGLSRLLLTTLLPTELMLLGE